MAAKKSERKRVHDALHDPSEFEDMLAEWEQYHGTKIDPATGEEISFDKIRKSEKARLFGQYLTQLQKDMEGKELDVAHARAKIFEIAKKTYLASIGLTEADAKKVKLEGLEDKVKEFLVMAAGGAQAGIGNYEQAIETIMSADDPFGVRDRDGMSKSLLSLLNQYTEHTYKSKELKVKVKGKEVAQTDKRLEYLADQLVHPEHRDALEARYTPLLKENYGDKAGFHKRASSGAILNETANLKNVGRISKLKAPHLVGVSGGKIRKKEEYRRAA